MFISELFPNDSLEEVYVSAKEKKRNPNVKVGMHVWVKNPKDESQIAAGKFIGISPTGLAMVMLNDPTSNFDIRGSNERSPKHISVPMPWLHADAKSAWPDPPWLVKKQAELAAKAAGQSVPKQGTLKLEDAAQESRVADMAKTYIAHMLKKGTMSRSAVNQVANIIHGKGIDHNQALMIATRAYSLLTGGDVREELTN